MKDQQYTLPEALNRIATYQKLCHYAVKHDKPVNDDIKGETHVMNSTFGKKNDFDFKVSLI